jgi:hypothetical protein
MFRLIENALISNRQQSFNIIEKRMRQADKKLLFIVCLLPECRVRSTHAALRQA